MSFAEIIDRVRHATMAVVIWSACAGILLLAALGWAWLGGEKPLTPPGWDCRWLDEENRSGKCIAADGWHIEDDPSLGRIAVRNITMTKEDRQTDLDTANGWRGLTNDQRREILAGRAKIYDYLEFSTPGSK